MPKQSNIIVFLSDQQRWDTMGCYGQKLNVTPNLDKLAKEGVVFENAFSCQPVCGPARACIQTGLYATQTGCFKNDIALPENMPTIASILYENDYNTAYIGKWHLASNGNNESYSYSPIPENRRGGYDYWMASNVLEFTSDGYEGGYVFDKDMNKVEFSGYRADEIGKFALNFIKEYNDEKPYLLFVSWLEPHHQNNKDICQGPIGSNQLFKDFEPPKDLEAYEGNWKKNYPDYLGACFSIDENIGKIVNYLENENKLDSTVILYTSDHGCHFKTRNIEYKRTCHEASIKIPLIVCGKGFEKGIRNVGLCSLIDIAPTILKSASIDIPKNMQGFALQDIETKNIQREEIFIQMSETQVGRAIRTKKWKYAIHAPDKNGLQDEFSEKYLESHLYDLENDPYELNNLVNNENYSEIRDELRRKIIEYILDVENRNAVVSGV